MLGLALNAPPAGASFGKAHCRKFAPLELSYGGVDTQYYVANRVCVVRTNTGGHGHGHYAYWYSWPAPSTHISGRLQVRLTFNGEIVARSKEIANPDVPRHLRSRPTLFGKGKWCARLWQHTRNMRLKIKWKKVGVAVCWTT
jgi:hypothetical protein